MCNLGGAHFLIPFPILKYILSYLLTLVSTRCAIFIIPKYFHHIGKLCDTFHHDDANILTQREIRYSITKPDAYIKKYEISNSKKNTRRKNWTYQFFVCPHPPVPLTYDCFPQPLTGLYRVNHSQAIVITVSATSQ